MFVKSLCCSKRGSQTGGRAAFSQSAQLGPGRWYRAGSPNSTLDPRPYCCPVHETRDHTKQTKYNSQHPVNCNLQSPTFRRLASKAKDVPYGTRSIGIPRDWSSASNWTTAGEWGVSAGTITAHCKFSRNSLVLICHAASSGGVTAPIWITDQ
jgi:hypothetical protein